MNLQLPIWLAGQRPPFMGSRRRVRLVNVTKKHAGNARRAEWLRQRRQDAAYRQAEVDRQKARRALKRGK
jgi:hypothetical protein